MSLIPYRLAAEKPNQIIGIFIREAEPGIPLDDTIGANLAAMKERFGEEALSTPRPRRTTLETPKPSHTARVMAYVPRTPKVQTPNNTKTMGGDYFGSAQITEEPESMPSSSSYPAAYVPRSRRTTKASSISSISSVASKMPEEDRKRYDLQIRVYKARAFVPLHIPIRIFQQPGDCVEIEGLIKAKGV